MNNLEIGKEYLFSDDGMIWHKSTLNAISGNENDSTPYRCKGEHGINHWFGIIQPLEEKPERKLYTQSMEDAGNPIEVGMWFKTTRGDEYECLLPVDSEGDVVYAGGDGAYGFYTPLPFPDPVDLIDGEAYEFECDNATIEKGIYYKGSMVNQHGNRDLLVCTNIKHLTVNKQKAQKPNVFEELSNDINNCIDKYKLAE